MKKKAIIEIKQNNNIIINYEVKLEYKNNKINYLEKDEKNTNVLFDINNLILIRDNKEMYMEYNFLDNNGSVYIKEIRNNLNIIIKTIEKEIKGDRIYIKYEIEKDIYEYKIIMEG